MSSISIQVRTYINGIMFSLLGNSRFCDYANSLGLEDMLVHYKESNDPLFASQIGFILSVLRNGNSLAGEVDEHNVSGEDEEEDDFDDEVCLRRIKSIFGRITVLTVIG